MKTIRSGQLVYWRDAPAIVIELKGLSDAVIRMLDTSRTEMAQLVDLTLSPTSSEPPQARHLLTSDKKWDEVVRRFTLIRPLLELDQRQLKDVQSVADTAGKSVTTIYRWLNRFEESGLVSSLLRPPRVDKGERKLSDKIEQIIEFQIATFYMKKERPTVKKLFERIKESCRDQGFTPPHKNTIYDRVEKIAPREKLAKRFSPKKAQEDFEPHRGSFPGADYPNAVVQIDHSPVDVIIVDEEHRLPIGRPFLTIALDVATKMITGYRMTLDPPGALSAGLCIAHAVQRKEMWLAKRDLVAEWPIHGKMTKVHLDNAKEFHGRMLERACGQHDIILEYRPRGQPNYGPHVERAFRTFMAESHSIPGTTFSNVQAKMEYDSEGKACMTLEELELWFCVFVVYCYHHKAHKGINNVPPIKLGGCRS